MADISAAILFSQKPARPVGFFSGAASEWPSRRAKDTANSAISRGCNIEPRGPPCASRFVFQDRQLMEVGKRYAL
jgi:hypothetical protein